MYGKLPYINLEETKDGTERSKEGTLEARLTVEQKKHIERGPGSKGLLFQILSS